MNTKLARYNIRAIKDNRRLYNVISNGDDNLFPDYLNGLYNNSVTHQSVINDLVRYILGNGLKVDNEAGQQILDAKLDSDKVKNILLYKLIHNSINLEVIKSNAGNFVEVGVFNPAQVRVSSVQDGDPCVFEYRKSWDRKDYNNYKVKQELKNIWKTDTAEGLFYWYDSGTFPVYYGRPNYMGGLNSIELEISIYMMHNHGAQNGMFPSMIISMESSGDKETDDNAIKSIQEQMTGVANAGKIGVFNYPAGGQNPTMSSPNLTGLDKIYENQYAVSEAGILKAHGIPSPLLIAGLNQRNSGFSSLEEEMQWAKEELFSKIVIPERNKFLEILDPVFRKLGIQGEIYFEDAEGQNIQQPVNDLEQDLSDVNDNLKNLTGRQLQGFERAIKRYNDGKWNYDQTRNYLKNAFALSDEDINEWISKPEELSALVTLDEIIEGAEDSVDGYVEWSVTEAIEELEHDRNELINGLNSAQKLASTGTARPNAKSEDDGNKGDVMFKVRYRYAGDLVGEREFCRKMLAANKLYRIEDINRMSFSGVNAGFGPRGARNYSIIKYKGGPNCKHKWERVTFVKEGLEGTIDTNSPLAKTLSETQADNRGMKPANLPKEYSQKPFDMPNRGYLMSAINSLKKWL